MASWGQLKLLPSLFTHKRSLSQVIVRTFTTHPTSAHEVPSQKNNLVDIGVTHDGTNIVAFHRDADISYDLTKPVPTPESIIDPAETYDLLLKSHLAKENAKNKLAPTIEDLSKVFYTTKHCWYPVGEYHRRRRKTNTPKDR